MIGNHMFKAWSAHTGETGGSRPRYTFVNLGDYQFSCAFEEKLPPKEKYLNYQMLGYEKHSRFSEEMPLLVDRNGEAVFLLHESVPTFDEGDRMYDSSRILYLMLVCGQWDGIYVGSGYEIGAVRYYGDLRGSNEESKALLEKYRLIWKEIQVESGAKGSAGP